MSGLRFLLIFNNFHDHLFISCLCVPVVYNESLNRNHFPGFLWFKKNGFPANNPEKNCIIGIYRATHAMESLIVLPST